MFAHRRHGEVGTQVEEADPYHQEHGAHAKDNKFLQRKFNEGRKRKHEDDQRHRQYGRERFLQLFEQDFEHYSPRYSTAKIRVAPPGIGPAPRLP